MCLRIKLYSNSKEYYSIISSVLNMSMIKDYIMMGGSAVEYYTNSKRLRSRDDIDLLVNKSKSNKVVYEFKRLGIEKLGDEIVYTGLDIYNFKYMDLEVQLVVIDDNYYSELFKNSIVGNIIINKYKTKCRIMDLLDLVSFKIYAISSTAGIVEEAAKKHLNDLNHLLDVLDSKTGSSDKSDFIIKKHKVKFFR